MLFDDHAYATPFFLYAFLGCAAVMAVYVSFGVVVYVRHRLLVAWLRRPCEPATVEGQIVDKLPRHERVHLMFEDLQCWAPDGKHILRGVTGQIKPGDLVAVMGPSGCGKTTLLDVLAGRRSDAYATSGRVYVNGLHSRTRAGKALLQQALGYMLQLAVCYCDRLTVKQNIAYSALMRRPGMSRCERNALVEQLIDSIGLRHVSDTVVGGASGGGLSGGQKRKLSLAIEMVRGPPLLFLDEPTSGLDTCSALELMVVLRQYAASGRAIAVTLHQPRIEIFSSFDALWLLHRGRTAFAGSPMTTASFLTELATLSKVTSYRFAPGANPADVVLDLLHHEGTLPRAQQNRHTSPSSRSHQSRSSRRQRQQQQQQRSPARGWTTATRRPRTATLQLVEERAGEGASVQLTDTNAAVQGAAGEEDEADEADESPKEQRLSVDLGEISTDLGPLGGGGETQTVMGYLGDLAVEVFGASGYQQRVRQKILAARQQNIRQPPMPTSLPPRPGGGRGSAVRVLWTRLCAMESRLLLNTSWAGYLTPCAQFGVALVFLSSLFMRPDKAYVVTSTVFQMANLGAAVLQPVLIQTHFGCLATTYLFESAAGCCSPLQFWLQQQLHMALQAWVADVPFVVLAYCVTFTAVEPLNLATTVLLHAVASLAYSSYFQLMCTLVWRSGRRAPTDANVALICVAALSTIFIFFGGFFIAEADAPAYWRWAFGASPIYYTFTATLRINLQGYSTRDCAAEASAELARRCEAEASGDAVLRNYGYEDVDVGARLLVLAGMWLGFASLTLLNLQCEARELSLLGWLRKRGRRARVAPPARDVGVVVSSDLLQTYLQQRATSPSRRTSCRTADEHSAGTTPPGEGETPGERSGGSVSFALERALQASRQTAEEFDCDFDVYHVEETPRPAEDSPAEGALGRLSIRPPDDATEDVIRRDLLDRVGRVREASHSVVERARELGLGMYGSPVI